MTDQPANASKPSLAPSERFRYLVQNESETMQTIVSHVANGGSLTSLCSTWEVSFSLVLAWIRVNDDRRREYDQALDDRGEWYKDSLLAELRNIALLDVRKIFDEQGKIKPIQTWPREISAALNNFEIVEYFEGQGKEMTQVGWLKKFKFFDKLKSIELLGKNLSMFIERHEHTGKVTLEQLVSSTGGNNGKEEKET